MVGRSRIVHVVFSAAYARKRRGAAKNFMERGALAPEASRWMQLSRVVPPKTCAVALGTSAPATIQHWRAVTVDDGQKSGETKSKKLSMMAAVQMFATEEKAEKWFIEQRWPDGIKCPHCESENVARVKTRKPQPFRCRTCRKHFSVRTGTPMQSSKIPLSKWALGFFLFSSHVKGISSIKLHDDLGIGQKAAWYMGHRIREAWNKKMRKFSTTVEFDEAAIGGKEKYRHLDKKYNLGRGSAGKTILAGAKDRGTNKIRMKVIPDKSTESIHQFVHETVSEDATIYTDELPSYKGTPFEHHWVIHAAKEYVRDDVHTNGIESIWALFRRTYHGIHHHMSPKHLQRYANECSGRLNMRGLSTVDKMTMILQDMEGKKVGYARLTEGGVAYPDIRNYDRPPRYLKYVGNRRQGGSNIPQEHQ